MEIIVLRNNVIFARARTEDDDAGTFTIMKVADADMPQYPTKDPGSGKAYELGWENGTLAWKVVDRPLTLDERLKKLEMVVDQIAGGR